MDGEIYRPVSLQGITWVVTNLTIIAGKKASKVIAETKVLNKDRHHGQEFNCILEGNVNNETSEEPV